MRVELRTADIKVAAEMEDTDRSIYTAWIAQLEGYVHERKGKLGFWIVVMIL